MSMALTLYVHTKLHTHAPLQILHNKHYAQFAYNGL